MTSITTADRAAAWNIRFLLPPPDDSCIAGTFQPGKEHGLFLTWSHIFDDLKLCFDLAPNARFLSKKSNSIISNLALWLRQESAAKAIGAPCVYLGPGSTGDLDCGGSQSVLDSLIDIAELVPNVDNEGDDISEPLHLDLTLVVHDSSCSLGDALDLKSHLSAGCAMHIPLMKNPAYRYVPIPTSSGNTNSNSTPGSGRGTPAQKRARTGSQSPTKDLPTKLLTPPDLEINIKKSYRGTCAISLSNTSWPGSTISGPGMQSCHIVPKALFRWFPHTDIEGEINDLILWNRTNSIQNCMLMDATTHAIHDLRLVAIQPGTKRVRVFAPISPLVNRTGRKARFPLNGAPTGEVLKWHYEMCVFENMCALILDAEGGAKRMPWREGPILLRTGAEVLGISGNKGEDIGGAEAEVIVDTSMDMDTEVPVNDGGTRKYKRKYTNHQDLSAEEDDTDHTWSFGQNLHTRLAEEVTRKKLEEGLNRWKLKRSKISGVTTR